MTELKDKIQNGLDEARMLILGAEILVGFEFTATFQPEFKKLSATSQHLNLSALILMLLAVGLLISPATFHQISEQGNDSVPLLRYTNRVMELALCPFAAALGASVYIPAAAIAGSDAGAILGLTVTLIAVFFWYGPVLLRHRHERARQEGATNMLSETQPPSILTPLHDKIRQVLTEARVIIPGNQALLGFQFAVILQTGFRELAPWLKWIHLVSLLFIAISTVLLLTPAAYHRIVEHGEETASFYRVAHVMVLCALPPLALGICGDFVLVIHTTTGNGFGSVVAAVLMLTFFTVLWFAYPWFRRSHYRGGNSLSQTSQRARTS